MKALASGSSVMTAQRKLMTALLLLGVIPLVLQIRGYLKLATPHKITKSLIVPPDAEPKSDNLLELCSLRGFYVGPVWWSVDMTHYYALERGYLCHFVAPEYNTHGNLVMKAAQVEACANESYSIKMFVYHGSLGYFSFYDEFAGTYCAADGSAFAHVVGIGTFDINGNALAQHLGSEGYRWSYWYCIVGATWIIFRGLVLRRCYAACKRYGGKCDQMGVSLGQRAAMIFVHENLRLSAHGATNYHRVLLLYLLLEGLMSDLFLLGATDGSFVWLQYFSLGYNLSGILLVLFEMIERMEWLSETYRLFVKRLLFSYESSLLGELLSASVQPLYLSSLNRSDMKNTRPAALAVSYYVWSLVGHIVIALGLIGFIMLVRILRAVTYVRWKHGRAHDIFWAPCCVDTTFGARNKMTKLGGYHWENGKLYYKADALKSFGLLKMEEEDGSQSLVLNKIRWFDAQTEDLVVIGSVSEERVDPCAERPCTGVVGFFDRNLGGPPADSERFRSIIVRRRSRVLPSPSHLNIIPT